jgi:hypothetical protein
MKRLCLTLTFALALGLMAFLPATAAAGEQRPMTGAFTVGVVPVDQRCGANALTIAFEGSGIGTHLGRFAGGGSNCTTFDLATSSVPIYDGSATFVAADGSTITASYEGTQQAPVNGVASLSATHTIVAGTGRFEDAAGVWESVGTIDFTTGTSTSTVWGWISY